MALSTALASPARAQGGGYAPVLQAVSPADQLAAVMRRLATAPSDLQALISAGELSVKLDDMSAAAAFFARANKIDPRNGRVKAGMASILVRAERPGEALRHFQMAERYGLPANRFAADRALALDLLGEQERAQRDYRLALRATPDEETVRRYALSLGISGRQTLALEQLEPLVRRQDRAAWRVRAFVLAMNGDLTAANGIATRMMPVGMAAGLRPFFERLPKLSAIDRAFAVHFGEVRPTPARLADARLKPALPALGPDPYAPPVQVAAVAPPATAAVTQARPGAGQRRERVQLASTASGSGPARRPAPTRPRQGSTPAATRSTGSAPVSARPSTPPVQIAARPTARPLPPATRPPARTAPTAPPSVASVAPGGLSQSAASATPPAGVAGPAGPLAGSATSAAPSSAAVAGASIAPASSAPVRPSGSSAAPPVALAGAAATAPVIPAPVTAVRSEDSILARIVGSITIPGEELGVTAPERRAQVAAATDPATVWTLAGGQVQAARETADRTAAARTIVAAARARPATRGRKGAAQSPATGKAPREEGEAEAGADKPRTAAEKRLAARRSAAEEKAAATKRDRGEPERIWVQVAGGANEADLPRAWSAAQRKAAALKGRQAYTASSRATNRVVTGPFKTASEAQAFVNQLARQGVSAFQFTSAAGQKMTRLAGK